MRKRALNALSPILLFFFCISSITLFGNPSAEIQLRYQYEVSSNIPSDINEHVQTLRALAKECSSVVEIGLREMVSSWGILQGLSESQSRSPTYLGIDIHSPSLPTLNLAKQLAAEHNIAFTFWQANDMDVDIEAAEMLFIDSLHIYCHLTYELEKFSPKITKYIAMHDTSDPWGKADEPYDGDYTEYPEEYDRTKRGLWAAVEDFLKRHPEWTLYKRYLNNHGFTILKRID